MTGKRISELCKLIPRGSSYLGYLPHCDKIPAIPQESVDCIVRWTHSINNPQFGWDLMNSFAECNQPLPPEIYEQPIADALLARRYGYSHPYTDYAYAFHTQKQFEAQKGMLMAMVLDNASVDTIMSVLGGIICVNTLLAWETLFFNVRDRLKERGFLLAMLYNEGPQIEHDPNYTRIEALDMLMMRFSYHYGWEHVEEWSGLKRRGGIELQDPIAAANQVESAIMTNALLSIRTGGLNQPHNPAISQARQLIQAAKQGGEDNQTHDLYNLGAIGSENAALSELGKMTSNMQERLDMVREQERAAAEAEQRAAQQKSGFVPKIVEA